MGYVEPFAEGPGRRVGINIAQAVRPIPIRSEDPRRARNRWQKGSLVILGTRPL